MKKAGRPKHPLTEKTYFRLTPKEVRDLEKTAKIANRSVAQEVRLRCFPPTSKGAI